MFAPVLGFALGAAVSGWVEWYRGQTCCNVAPNLPAKSEHQRPALLRSNMDPGQVTFTLWCPVSHSVDCSRKADWTASTCHRISRPAGKL